MPTDTQIANLQQEAAPLTYTLPGDTQIRVKAVHASFDGSGAGGTFLPAVQLVSDSGHVIATAADQAVTVAAGGSADASFFPGVKHAASSGGTSYPFALETAWADNGGGTVVASGVQTSLQPSNASAGHEGATNLLSTIGIPPGVVVAQPCVIAIEAVLIWNATFVGNRFLQLLFNNGTIFPPAGGVNTYRGPVSPDGSRDSISCVLAVTPGINTFIDFQVTQTSGVGQTVSAFTGISVRVLGLFSTH